MNLYQKYILPFILNKAMQNDMFTEIRREIIPKAIGTVLEIGFGSGLNMPFYKQDGSIDRLYALEPSLELFEKYVSSQAQNKANLQPIEVNYLHASAESIPLPDASVNTVVSTWTMCTIPNPGVALSEISRVLKPGGTFIFVEHGLSPHKVATTCQRIGTPFSKCLAGGCHLNRDIKSLLTSSPLQIKELKTFSRKYRPLEYTYQGSALKI